MPARQSQAFTIEALVRGVQDLRDEFQALRKEIMPRDEVETRITAVSERVAKLEANPNSVRGWLGLALSLGVGLVTAGGCLFSVLMGMAGIIVSIITLVR